MEKQIAQFTNRGMYQDVSISKATNEFAFENLNIKITTLEDNTLFTVTNVKEPRQISTISGGTYLGHCVLGKYVVVFIKGSTVNTDKIVRLDYNGESFVENQLYIGNLGFNNPIECLPYYESEEVQKVYWVDGENYPRMINIVNVWKTSGDDTQFDFNPTVDVVPNVEVSKNYRGVGLFSPGVIQYFITYYDKFGTESSIAWASPLYYINYLDRGGSPEDLITCDFELNITGTDASYDYFRVYSLKRNSLNGEAVCNIVQEVRIKNESDNLIDPTTYLVVDSNTNQSSIDVTKLYFLGGESFIASTLTQKNNTLFLGDIKTPSTIENEEFLTIKKAIESTRIIKDSLIESSLVEFTDVSSGSKKRLKGNRIDGFYYNNFQTNKASNTFKTFKRGETYRFAIQFQNKRGEWSIPIWIGDKKCTSIPSIEIDNVSKTETLILTDVKCSLTSLTSDIKTLINKNFYKYRVLMADTTQDKSIIAQGVVCPTLFNYNERLENKPYAISSWIMRPRGSNVAWRHMDVTNTEIHGQDNRFAPTVVTNASYNEDCNYELGYTTDDGIFKPYNGIALVVIVATGHRLYAALHNTDVDLPNYGVYSKHLKLIKKISFNKGTWKTIYYALKEWCANYDIDLDNIAGEAQFIKFCKGNAIDDFHELSGPWSYIPDPFDVGFTSIPFALPNGSKHGAFIAFETNALRNTGKNDLNLDSKKNYFYVDNSILTFHSPDVEDNKDLIQDANLNFRIVGIVPISSSFSDADIQFNTPGLSQGAVVNKDSIINYPNLSKTTETLISKSLYRDLGWSYEENIGESGLSGFIPDTTFVDYDVFLWHKQGSMVGQNEQTFKGESANNFDSTQADLKRKIFGTQRFSYTTKYFEPSQFWSPNKGVSPVQYFDSDSIEVKQLFVDGDTEKQEYGKKVFYYGNYDKLLTVTDPYTVGKLQQYDPVRIKYKSTPHAVFSLWDNTSKLDVLPKLEWDGETEIFKDIYTSAFEYPAYAWSFEEPLPFGNKCLMVLPSSIYGGTLASFKEALKTNLNDVYYNIKKLGYFLISSDPIGSTFSKVEKIIYADYVGYSPAGDMISFNEFFVNDTGTTSAGFPKFPNGEYFDFYGVLDYNPYYNFISSVGKVNADGNVEYTFGILYDEQESIEGVSAEGYSYLYMGELYRDIPYESLYGGTTETALENIKWLPITQSTSLDEVSENAEGDTYYQRWDCLKTYPYTEEDINSVVDITSFMVETRINLEGRYDRNIGTTNILNIRPSNFNLRNKVYDQQNNFFTYNILDSKYNENHYYNQIVWSLQKAPLSEIDVWTDISLASALNLDGSYGKITKLINNNDTILAFQDKAISAINFNNRTALSTENGVPIEIANSGKVDGYKVITDTIGCQNKQLMTKANSGLYFIDGLNKSLFSIGADGVKNVSNNGMSVWFRNNIDNITELTYDGLSKDIYVLTSTKALLYNEDLGNFTTFLDFVTDNYSTIFNMEGRAIGFNQEGSSIAINEMNVGDYNSDYRITYRINPEPFLDKTFTNIEYIANFDNNINNPFKKLIAENEYQYGTSEIVNTKYPTDYKKFRIWRFDVPRDDNTARTINGRTVKLDRIRNPWFNLTLVGNDSIDNNSMEFHNLNVYYYR